MKIDYLLKIKEMLASSKPKIRVKLKKVKKKLFGLNNLIVGEFICRPSKFNKSPFVGDVMINGEEKIVHIPSMDMGGKCTTGTKIYMKEAKSKGKKSSKYGTPCCDYISQAIIVNERENKGEIICGAHPALGEMVASEIFKQGSIFNVMSNYKITNTKAQVCKIAGCDMRSDFLVTTEDNTHYLVEVKTIVDTDYDIANKDFYSKTRKKSYYGNNTGEHYRRKGLFPWGGGNQKGPNGEKVVSARAIKHVREMTEIVKGNKSDPQYEKLVPFVLFVAVRDDISEFSPNKMACPSFNKYLKEGYDLGLKMAAISVSFEEQIIDQKCSISVKYNRELPIVFIED
jgi:DNA-binding sugar fermentation-stimulating protein